MPFQNYEVLAPNQYRCFIDDKIYSSTELIPDYGTWSVFARNANGKPAMYFGDSDISKLPTNVKDEKLSFLKELPKALTLTKVVYSFNLNTNSWERMIND